MSSLPPLPDELKHISPFLQRGQELQKREPVIAYYCKFYAAKISIGKAKAPESKMFLAKLLDVLESDKKAISDNDAITDDVAAMAYVENFALKIFYNADNEDRAGNATKKTAKTFLAAAIFLELVKVFGDIEQEIEEKIKYAKWKASDIARALRDGQKPTPGPPGWNPDEKKEQAVQQNEASEGPIEPFPSAPAADGSQPSIPIEPFPPAPTGGGIEPFPSAPTTSGIEPFPSAPPVNAGQASLTSQGNSWPPFSSPVSGNENVQNGQHDAFGAFTELSGQFGQLDMNVQSPHQAPPVPPKVPDFPAFPNAPGAIDNQYGQPSAQPTTNYPPQTAISSMYYVQQPSFDVMNNQSGPSMHPSQSYGQPPYGPTPYQQSPPPSQPPSAPTHPAQLQPQPHSQMNPQAQPPQSHQRPDFTSAMPPVARPPSPPHKVDIDPSVISLAQKHARWAISALNYNDIKTAMDNLQKAQGMLEKYR